MFFNSVSQLIWNRKKEVRASIYGISYDKSFLNIDIKIELLQNDSNISKKTQVIVKARHTEISYNFNLDIKEKIMESQFGRALIPGNIFENADIQTWDFYVKLNHKGEYKIIRIEDFLTNVSGIDEFELNRKLAIKPYSTDHGNFL